MNPLSVWIYYCRHKRHAAILLSLSMIVTLGLYSLVAWVWGAFVEPGRLAYNAYAEFSLVAPKSTNYSSDPAVLEKLQANPDISKIIPSTFIRIELPGIIPEQGFQFELMGILKDDISFFLDRFSASVSEGRLPQPGAAEIVLSEDVANMLDVMVGDNYIITSFEFYVGMEAPPKPTTFKVVGILDSENELGIVSLEFLNEHEQYRQLPARFLVFAQEGRKAAVDGFLRKDILDIKTGVMTQEMLSERIINEATPGLMLLLPVILIVAFAFSLVIVAVNQLANAQRLPEFGILHATGRSKHWLVRRLTLETAMLSLSGWLVGIGLAYLSLNLFKMTLFAARGFDFNYVPWLPLTFSIPIPLVITGSTFFVVKRTFSRLDPVAIVEQRIISLETGRKYFKPITVSSSNPLSPATFYRRHRRRAIMLISTMGLMIIAVVLFIFSLAVGADAKEPFLGYLSQVSIVRSPGIVQSLNPDVVALIKDHPAVERMIPVAPRYSMLNVQIPPFESAEASPFGVYHEDLIYLVELYRLELKEGSLPRPGTNDMVIPEALAQNRGLKVGDVIGNPERPAYPGAPSLENEFIISGIFAQPAETQAGSGWGFISLEFQETRGILANSSLILVAKEGQKGILDDWLENELTGVDASVMTLRQEISRIQDKGRQDMFSMAVLEIGIAIVAAVGLAILNHIFTSQRQLEFGVLHALGYNRRQLVRRVFGETALIIGLAWGLTALLCLTAMIGLQFGVFQPMGLTFDLFDITPWLFTLPIPVAVLAVSAGTTAQTLAKLDPISVIDRRL